MAVIKHIRGLEVTIEVKGATAREYDPADEEDAAPPLEIAFHVPERDAGGPANGTPYVVKYIEAQPGEAFNFRIKRQTNFRNHGHHIAAAVQADDLRLSKGHDETDPSKIQYTPWERNVDAWVSYDASIGYQDNFFCFASLNIEEANVSPAEAKRQLSRMKTLGLLRVSLYYMKKSRLVPIRFGDHKISPVKNVAEKCLKGRTVDSATSYETKPARQRPTAQYEDVFEDKSERPFAVFDFRYRSMDGLIKGGIVSREPIEREMREMSDAEARRLAKELLELRRNQTADSAGASSLKDEKPGLVKRELEEAIPLSDQAFQERYKSRRLNNGRFEVDLTDEKPRMVKREPQEATPLSDQDFQGRYKTCRLNNGRFEVDLTDD